MTVAVTLAPPPRIRSLRWLAVAAATVLLHLFLASWVGGHLSVSSARSASPQHVEVALLPPPPASPAPLPPPPARLQPAPASTHSAPTKPKPQSPSRLTRKSPPQTPSAVFKPQALPVITAPEPATAGPDHPDHPALPPALPQAGAPEAQEDSLSDVMPDIAFETGPPQLQWQSVDLPPSATLRYKAYALKMEHQQEQHWYGTGVFHWEARPGAYRLQGEASVSLLFFRLGVLNFSSEGVINEFGLAPVHYREKPRSKPGTHTYFSHSEETISFSNGTIAPYRGGEQDRASLIWQLAGIGRAAAAGFEPGAELEVVVAGPRNADTWRLRVMGLVDVAAGGQALKAWHIARIRQRNEGEDRIDVWLAPDLHWYPVRLRQAEADGSFLELGLSEWGPLETQATVQE